MWVITAMGIFKLRLKNATVLLPRIAKEDEREKCREWQLMAGFKRAFPYRTTPSSLRSQPKHIANRQTFTGFADSLFKKIYKQTMRFKDFIRAEAFIPAVLGNALRRNKGYKNRLQPPYENIQCETLSTVPRCPSRRRTHRRYLQQNEKEVFDMGKG